MLPNLLASLSRFRRDRRANFAVMTALCAFPLIGMMGLAIDYGVALSNKTKLDAAADAAAIAAVTKARTVLKNGGLLTDALSQGQQQGQAAFAANAGGATYLAQKGVTPSVQFQPTLGQSLTVNVTYTMNGYSQFGKLFNVGQYTVGGASSSNTVLMPYYQFIFVVDISNSMAVGGTANDISGLMNDRNITAASSGQQCAFACHTGSGANPRAIAKADGWKLKIDYVNAATQAFINSLDQQTTSNPALQSSSKTLGYFSVGIDTFGSVFNTAQQPVNPPSLASNAAKNIDVEAAVYANNGTTNTASALASALNGISNVGDGSSATAQATYVILISDGVEDQLCWGCTAWGRYTDLSYTSACAAIKKKGITLISIEAAYPSIPGDDQYNTLVAPLQPSANGSNNMQIAMQTCASDNSWYFHADDGPGINAAVNSVLARVMQGLTRLTY